MFSFSFSGQNQITTLTENQPNKQDYISYQIWEYLAIHLCNQDILLTTLRASNTSMTTTKFILKIKFSKQILISLLFSEII
jgi:hypothetical protein